MASDPLLDFLPIMDSLALGLDVLLKEMRGIIQQEARMMVGFRRLCSARDKVVLHLTERGLCIIPNYTAK